MPNAGSFSYLQDGENRPQVQLQLLIGPNIKDWSSKQV